MEINREREPSLHDEKEETNIVCRGPSEVGRVEGEESSSGGGSRGARVQLDHEVVVHVAYIVSCESKLVSELEW